jgi:hypothetical protein
MTRDIQSGNGETGALLKFRFNVKPVGGDLSAKGPACLAHISRLKHRLRGQVRSHIETGAAPEISV